MDYEKRLRSLALYMSDGFRSARDVMRRFRCSKYAAYTRLAKLEELGCVFEKMKTREGRTGPLSRVMRLHSGPAELTSFRRASSAGAQASSARQR